MNIIESIDGLEMGAIGPDSMVQADCLEAMALIPDKSIDSIICDLPYGITACKWDTVIPFDRLWEQYKRIIKPNGAIVLFGSQPFTSALVMSNPKWFKYEWIWNKKIPSGMSFARYQPMRQTENISVFSSSKTIYYPQFTKRETPIKSGGMGNSGSASTMGYVPLNKTYSHKCPTNLLTFDKIRRNSLHPTQKPVSLIEYLIKTYTIEGELILDNTSGSSTTAIAAINTNRNYICMEKDLHYFQVSCDRVATHNPNAPIVKPKKPKAVAKGQLALF